MEKSFRSKGFRHKSKIGSFLAPRNAEPALYSALKTCKYVNICVWYESNCRGFFVASHLFLYESRVILAHRGSENSMVACFITTYGLALLGIASVSLRMTLSTSARCAPSRRLLRHIATFVPAPDLVVVTRNWALSLQLVAAVLWKLDERPGPWHIATF